VQLVHWSIVRLSLSLSLSLSHTLVIETCGNLNESHQQPLPIDSID